jgi:hypothetical protein
MYHKRMDASPRLIGSSGSVFATALLFGSIAAFWPAVRYCPYWECGGSGGYLLREEPVVTTWRPYIVNPGTSLATGESYPTCPAPQSVGDGFSLVDAPLPAAFDPFASAVPLFACVLVGPDGKVLQARLLGTGAGAARAALLGSMRKWRITSAWRDSVPATWQRVRLDAGPARDVITVPPDSY